MSTHIGPTRLVVIRSGKYDYGEIDLTDPVHLVGPNNVGKTSLIALLQLLYVDNQIHMSFSRPLDESKRYYFPDTDSYVLFEVLTPTGFQVVGAHGLGRVKRNDFERFVYQGRFKREDFLDSDRRVREAKEIKTRLAPQGFVTLEPKHLRAALTGMGESKGVHLGLVPLRHRDQYERFRALFQHLLKLAQIRQAELKSLLLEIYRTSFRQHSIDLGKEVAEQLRIIRKSQGEVRKLKELQPDVEKLLKAVKARDEAREPLPRMWKQVGQAATKLERDLEQQFSDQNLREEELTAEEKTIHQERETFNREHAELIKRSGHIEDLLARLAKDHLRFQGFVQEFKEQEQADLERQIEQLTVRLHSGGQESRSDLEQRLHRSKRNQEQLKGRLNNLAHSVGSRVAKLLPDPAGRDAVFKLIDARLLQLPCNETGLEINSESDLQDWLHSFQQSLAHGYFAGCGVRIDLSALPAADLEEYLSADRIAEDLASLDREVKRLENALEAMAEADRLRRERQKLQQQRDALLQELTAWHRYQEATLDEPQLKVDHQEGTEKLAVLDRNLKQAQERLQEIGLSKHYLETTRNDIQRQLMDLREMLGQLQAPVEEWTAAEADSGELPATPDSSLGFADLAARYLRFFAEQQRHDNRVQDLLQLIEDRTYGKYLADTETATIANLRNELEALPEKESSTDQLWHALAVGLRSSFKQLWQDLETLKGHVATLNRQLGAVTVSNLERVRLVIEDRPEWGRRMKDMLDFDDMPLFADPAKADAAVDEIGKLLDKHEKVDLGDLFGLQFEVTTVGGRTKHYKNLDSVESNGTTITMKVLINVLMLRELLHSDEVRIPFYLDEASSLDHDNLAAIVQYSSERGFVPVLASPDPMEAASRLYFVAEQNGRVVLDPQQSVVTLRPLDSNEPASEHQEGGVV